MQREAEIYEYYRSLLEEKALNFGTNRLARFTAQLEEVNSYVKDKCGIGTGDGEIKVTVTLSNLKSKHSEEKE